MTKHRIACNIRGGAEVLGVILLLGSCAQPAATIPVQATVLSVEMRDYSFTPERSIVDAGRVVLLPRNVGEKRHEMVFAALPPDMPPLKEELASKQTRAILPVAAIPARAPGESGSVALDLPPGRYAFLCFVKDPDGVQHILKGMALELRVKARAGLGRR